MGGLCMEKNSLFEIQFPLSRTQLGNFRTPHGGLANSTGPLQRRKIAYRQTFSGREGYFRKTSFFINVCNDSTLDDFSWL